MSSSDENDPAANQRQPGGQKKLCLFSNARRIGFSPQEIKHLKRLYEGKIENKESG